LNIFAPSSASNKDVFVEFRAGQMIMDTNTKWVRPDKRKGLVQLKKADDLIHFIWKDRLTGQVEHDLILFPGDASFRKVNEAQGRVYLLAFETGRKLFFWMQDSNADKEQENVEKMNKILKEGAPVEEQQPKGLAALRQLTQPGNEALLSALSQGAGIDQNQLLGLLAQAQARGRGRGVPSPSTAPRPSPGAASTSSSGSSSSSASHPGPAASSASSNVQNALKNVLGRFGQQQPSAEQVAPSLGDVIDPDKIIASGLFDQPAVLQELGKYLPGDGNVTVANLKEHVRSPQFQQAVEMFNAALRSGQLNTILQSFGLPPSTSTSGLSTIEDFLAAIQKQAKEKKEDKMDLA